MINGLDPEFAAILRQFEGELLKAGIKVRRTSDFRSYAQQDALYARGRTKPGQKVTNARGGQSWHNFGLAADYAFVTDGKVTWQGPWEEFGRIAVKCGLEWGGDFRQFSDRPHVQMRSGRTINEMRSKNA